MGARQGRADTTIQQGFSCGRRKPQTKLNGDDMALFINTRQRQGNGGMAQAVARIKRVKDAPPQEPKR
jgi:hypothetical protein